MAQLDPSSPIFLPYTSSEPLPNLKHVKSQGRLSAALLCPEGGITLSSPRSWEPEFRVKASHPQRCSFLLPPYSSTYTRKQLLDRGKQPRSPNFSIKIPSEGTAVFREDFREGKKDSTLGGYQLSRASFFFFVI